MFRRVEEISVSATERVVKEGELAVAPSELVRVFGPPTSEYWDAESLGAFYFRGPGDQPFMLYCRAYDLTKHEVSQLRSSFWLDVDARSFNIGTLRRGDVGEFKIWVGQQLAQR